MREPFCHIFGIAQGFAGRSRGWRSDDFTSHDHARLHGDDCAIQAMNMPFVRIILVRRARTSSCACYGLRPLTLCVLTPV